MLMVGIVQLVLQQLNAISPILTSCCWMLVSGMIAELLNAKSSQPITATSWGTRSRPSLTKTCKTPIASRSLVQKMASGRSSAGRSRMASATRQPHAIEVLSTRRSMASTPDSWATCQAPRHRRLGEV